MKGTADILVKILLGKHYNCIMYVICNNNHPFFTNKICSNFWLFEKLLESFLSKCYKNIKSYFIRKYVVKEVAKK